MQSVFKCPVCNGSIIPGDHECKRCGFRLAGKTEVFKPVQGEKTAEAAPASAAKYRFSLYVTKGPQSHESFFLESARTTLGRDPQCDIFLNDMTVSREHAAVIIDGDDVTVRDLGSLNGTWVDGEIVDDAKLVAGSVLQIGTFKMVLQEHSVI